MDTRAFLDIKYLWFLWPTVPAIGSCVLSLGIVQLLRTPSLATASSKKRTNNHFFLPSFSASAHLFQYFLQQSNNLHLFLATLRLAHSEFKYSGSQREHLPSSTLSSSPLDPEPDAGTNPKTPSESLHLLIMPSHSSVNCPSI